MMNNKLQTNAKKSMTFILFCRNRKRMLDLFFTKSNIRKAYKFSTKFILKIIQSNKKQSYSPSFLEFRALLHDQFIISHY